MAAAELQSEKIRTQEGFIAALDQSGGSTPKALLLYGLDLSTLNDDMQRMFTMVHAMRTRIITNPAFNGARILGSILFEDTMNRSIEGIASAEYLWRNKNIVPFLKVDKGLAAEANGVQLMKPNAGLETLLARGKEKGIFGTKMRSVIKQANADGIKTIVDQQFALGRQILQHALTPIIEPEIDIHCPHKGAAEELLKKELSIALEQLDDKQQVMFKLTLPERSNHYRDFVHHPNVLKLLALSGGYSREAANARLAANSGMVASFSRALTEGLQHSQSDQAFSQQIEQSVQSIFDASVA